MQCWLQRHQGGRPPVPSVIRVFTLSIVALLGVIGPFAAREAAAQLMVPVDSEATLRQAILTISGNVAKGLDHGPIVIDIYNDITLTRSLPIIRALPRAGNQPPYLAIHGNNHTIDAANTGRVFFIASGRVDIGNLTIKNAYARGGAGGTGALGGGGGGGLGAGAALFVNTGADVAVVNVIVDQRRGAGRERRRPPRR